MEAKNPFGKEVNDMEELKKLALEMNSDIVKVAGLIESLVDVETEIGHLRESMDTAVHRGEERVYYREQHRSVRIYHDLMHYIMKDLVEASEKVYAMHLSMFEAIEGKGEQNQSA